ncbi:MAG: PadR family transcriptional regulator [Planctomycetota bacterium]|jgi:PadR family transcriptional regulator PadR
MYIDNWQTQLRKGMLDIVIMNLLSHGSCHGYEMVQRMKKITVQSFTQPSADGPPRKYFKVTAAGTETLEQMNAHWEQMIDSISHIRKGDFG